MPNTRAGTWGCERGVHTKVAFFKDVRVERAVPENIGLFEVLQSIRTGRWAEEVKRLREIRAANAERYRHEKCTLPAFCISGSAKNRKEPLDHSGILGIDIDKIGTTALGVVRDRLKQDRHVLFGFVSPSGEGLKLGLCIDGARHSEAFVAAKAYFKAQYGLEIDKACRDRLRLCFVSYDPDLWTRQDTEPLPIPEAQPAAPAPTEGTETTASASPALLVLPSGEVSISESAREIFSRIAPSRTLFWRGGALVELSDVDGQPKLELLKPESFRSRVENFGQLYAWRARKDGEACLVPTTLSRDTASAIMASLEARVLPPIGSVLRCPVLVEPSPGEIAILGKGYHPELGGLLILEGETPPQLPVEEAASALQWLLEEFDFQTDGDRARALAAFVTPALRLGGHLRGPVPIDVAEADQSQAGKGYRHALVCALYHEQAYFVTARQGGVGSVDESFAAALIGGRPFICLDNLRGRLDSQHLESFLTATGAFPARVPHRGEVLVNPQRFLLQLSSNGLESTRDLMNRASIVRIRKRPGYAFRDTLGELQARQAHFLGAVFSLIACWLGAGKPCSAVVQHDFREYAGTLGWICENLLGTVPLFDGHRAAQERASNPALSWLRLLALAVERENRLGEPMIASELAEVSSVHGLEIPGLRAADEDTSKRQVGILARRLFGENGSTLEVDGFTVTREHRQQARGSDGGAFDVKTYTFRRQ
ncbi:MAG TPA: BT4734/BF3469 family protein [Verrucomicrobiota bacterium]|nr:BT4734/BF3469 family protein [Verrucomicrobiota bacterium]